MYFKRVASATNCDSNGKIGIVEKILVPAFVLQITAHFCLK
jgi:hypothetical protein